MSDHVTINGRRVRRHVTNEDGSLSRLVGTLMGRPCYVRLDQLPFMLEYGLPHGLEDLQRMIAEDDLRPDWRHEGF